jgi:hypothetical protein
MFLFIGGSKNFVFENAGSLLRLAQHSAAGLIKELCPFTLLNIEFLKLTYYIG